MGVTSNRWRVKTRRVVPNEGSSNTFCAVNLRAGGKSVSRAASVPIVVYEAGDGLTQNEIITAQHHLLYVYPLSMLLHVTELIS